VSKKGLRFAEKKRVLLFAEKMKVLLFADKMKGLRFADKPEGAKLRREATRLRFGVPTVRVRKEETAALDEARNGGRLGRLRMRICGLQTRGRSSRKKF
jgi:hypothetical protein